MRALWIGIGSALVMFLALATLRSVRRRAFRKLDTGKVSDQWLAEQRGTREGTDK
jgi:hypothetical protein